MGPPPDDSNTATREREREREREFRTKEADMFCRTGIDKLASHR